MTAHPRATPQLPPTLHITACRGRKKQIAALWGLLLLLPTTAMAYALWRSAFFYSHYGPAAAYYRTRPFWWLTLALALSALALGLRLHWRRKSTLHITGQGLTLTLPPRRPQHLAWDEVQGLTLRLYRGGRQGWRGALVVHTPARSWRLDGRFPDLPRLARILQRWWYLTHRESLKAQWQQGRPLPFGGVSLSPQGLRYRERLFPWKTVQRLSIDAGALVIELSSGQQVAIPLAEVQTPDALLWWLYEEQQR